jgi:hypothetical protein
MFAAGKAAAVSVAAKDSQFNLTTLLLHGDGTNGANNNVFADSSTNGYTVTRSGNTTQGTFSPFSQTGWSAYIPSGSYVSANYVVTLQSNWSIECWFYPTGDISGGVVLFDCRPGLTNGYYPELGMTTSTFDVYYNNTSHTVAISNLTNQWHHVALVKYNGNLNLYLDGTSIYSVADSNSWGVGSNRPVIGVNGYNTSASLFQGYISNFRFLDGSAAYTGNFTPSTTPLTAITNTKILTLQSNRFVDNSVSPQTLTLSGTPSVQPFSPFAPSIPYDPSTVVGSAYFNGSTDYLSISSGNLLNVSSSSNWTIEAWVYPTSAPGGYLQFFGGNPGFSFGTYNGTLTVTDNATQIFIAGTPVINSWNHVALVNIAGTSCSMYLNGARTATGSARSFSSSATYIGANYTASQLWPGYISQARITNTAVYSGASYTVPTAPLTAITGTQLLLSGTNAAIYDQTSKNDIITVSTAQVSTTSPKYGTGSILFNGTSDGLTAPSTPRLAFGTGDFTVEFWIKTTKTAQNVIWITGGWAILIVSGSIYWQTVQGSSSLYYRNYSTANLLDGSWHHVAITRSSGANRMFIDGKMYSYYAATQGVDPPSTDSTDYAAGQLNIGTNGTYGWFGGNLDDIRITKGYARYTTASNTLDAQIFTPPTKAFPNQ